MSSPPVTRRFTTAEYYRMVAAGILGEDDRVELVDGRVVQMTPLGPRHAGCVKAVADLLRRALGSSALLGVQDPITLGEGSEPQPVVTRYAVVVGERDDAAPGRPPADIARSSRTMPTPDAQVVKARVATRQFDDDLATVPIVAIVGHDHFHVDVAQRLVLERSQTAAQQVRPVQRRHDNGNEHGINSSV